MIICGLRAFHLQRERYCRDAPAHIISEKVALEMKPLKHEEHTLRCQNNLLHEALMIILSLEFSVFFVIVVQVTLPSKCCLSRIWNCIC